MDKKTLVDLLFAAVGIGSGLYLIMTDEYRTLGYLGIAAGTLSLVSAYRRTAEEVEALEQEVNNDDHGL